MIVIPPKRGRDELSNDGFKNKFGVKFGEDIGFLPQHFLGILSRNQQEDLSQAGLCAVFNQSKYT